MIEEFAVPIEQIQHNLASGHAWDDYIANFAVFATLSEGEWGNYQDSLSHKISSMKLRSFSQRAEPEMRPIDKATSEIMRS